MVGYRFVEYWRYNVLWIKAGGLLCVIRGRLPVCLGERHTGSVEVLGSIPTVSTIEKSKSKDLLFSMK